MTKEQWKIYYRLLRVQRRETMKAAIDVMIYGRGAVFIPDDGSDPRHVPIEELNIQ